MILYHGSQEDRAFKITDTPNPFGVSFGGIFASRNYDAARSHGKYVFVMEIENDAVLTDYDLNYGVEYQKSRAALVEAFGREINDAEESLLWPAVIEENWRQIMAEDEDGERPMLDALCALIDLDEAETGWECQRLRGQVAKILGYKAVEMSDEHGTSYLVLPGTELQAIKN